MTQSSLFYKAVLYWPGTLETTTGFPILPSGGSVTATGTYENVTLDSGKILRKFNTGYLTISNSTDFDFGSGDFTICFWSNVMSNGEQNFRVLFARSNVTNFNSIQALRDVGGITLYMSSNGSSWDVVPTVNIMSGGYNEIYHCAIIRSGNTISAYKNGVLTWSTTSSATLFTRSEPFSIGRWINQSMNYMHGWIKDFIIYKGRALTVPELRTIMQRTDPTKLLNFSPDTTGDYWK